MDTPAEAKTPTQDTTADASVTSKSPSSSRLNPLSRAISDIRRQFGALLETDVESFKTQAKAAGSAVSPSTLGHAENSVLSIKEESPNGDGDQSQYGASVDRQLRDLSRTVVSRLEDLRSRIVLEMSAASGDPTSKKRLRQYWLPESYRETLTAEKDLSRENGDTSDTGDNDETLESLLGKVTKVTTEVKVLALTTLMPCTCNSASPAPLEG